MRTYVFKSDKYYYKCDDFEGDILVTNKNDASIYSQKQIEDQDLEFVLNEQFSYYCKDKLVKLDTPFKKIKL
jgi:hypothetical protein